MLNTVLAQCTTLEKVVTESRKKAAEWFTRAAEQGNAEAQYSLGDMYCAGNDIPRDNKKAVEWYTKAAEQGNAIAQNLLGHMYFRGECVYKDKKKAAIWYTKVAEQGKPEAQVALGEMYHLGEGVTRDDEKAVEWLAQAAGQEDSEAQYKLGKIYFTGDGVAQERKKRLSYIPRLHQTEKKPPNLIWEKWISMEAGWRGTGRGQRNGSPWQLGREMRRPKPILMQLPNREKVKVGKSSCISSR